MKAFKMFQNKIADKKAIAIIQDIIDGKLKITPLVEPQRMYAGDIQYKIDSPYSNYGLTVFNDCNEFDYIDSIWSADFTVRVFDWFNTFETNVVKTTLSELDIWKIFQIPGYCKFRCTQCATVLPDAFSDQKEFFLCKEHC